MTNVVIGGNAYSDDGSASRDMRSGGHRNWLLPMIADTMVRVAAAEAAATAAGNSATAAAGSAAALVGTSASSVAIGTGSKSFTASTGKQWPVGTYLALLDTALPTTNAMWGVVTAYNSGTGALTVTVETTIGSGTISAWTIALSGKVGPAGGTGATGAAGSSLTSATLSTNTTLLAADGNKFLDVTATCTLTLSAPATLGSTWWTWVRNGGAAGTVVTLAHTSGNVDGVVSFKMYEGEVRFLRCNGTTVTTFVVVPFRRYQLTSSTTIDMPPGYRELGHDLMSGAAGGASGGRSASAVDTYGGPGGCGGGRVVARLDAPAVNTTISLNVGAGGNGAAGRTTDGVAVAGADGSTSSIVWSAVTRAQVLGGQGMASSGGAGGRVTANAVSGSYGYGLAGAVAGLVGASLTDGVGAEYGGASGGPRTQSSGLPANKGGSSVFGGPGGGAGGWVEAGTTAYVGAAGGTRGTGTAGGGGAGGALGANGGTAADSGGGGGGGRVGAAAGSGANGTGFGCGGGGGGAVIGAFNSGAGGNGTGGYVTVWGIV